MATILDGLRTDHSRMTKLLDALERQIDAFSEGGRLDFPIVDGILYYCQTYPDRHHHPCEDMVFDRLKQRDPAATAAIGDLQSEHGKLAALTARFATILGAVEQDMPMERSDFTEVAKEFLEAYRHHIMMEEKHFFPAAQARLTPQDWRQLLAQLDQVKDPLFELREDQRFDALYEDLVAWDRNLPAGV